MSGQLYDGIGEAFEGFKTLPLARYAEVPGFLALVGDVHGKSVLDLACGTGFYSREFMRCGASRVLGVDISRAMVGAARALEDRDPLGVRYEVGDVAGLRALEPRFDVAVAVQLFNYAEDVATIARMCRNIHRSITDGAEFFAFAQNPDFRFGGPSLAKYGFLCESLGEETPIGPRVRITALLDPPISFVANPPGREVYEECLRAAGFDELTWVPLEVSADGVRAYGEDFWDDYTTNPPLTMLRCRA
ncbi:ToxA protein [Streptomyces eurocidicus]|uniref:SAM-dependent methyltransferase n=1 Tax=Streptomyces eurocidicus TaxID=66423 RepID=A0A2N8P1F5_STREU|nr:class I SAM-dependent methyltransferase [Streptomyces eurocidicus]MBB5121797.1 SAM-dependent methyltransferase [Streptomyces eurocidicus]MBF6055063.1 methyltransferase domain-containing protein [Streptomyces eurocidicus]PNE34841.1 ToxA protein [Streptomyces eurocidicus]